ncbi:hypothetical protein [Cellulomonas sp. NPDC089187]|uniref:DUF4178 domain-containing protein n=1 Tax=Cellulomonas sp. NPDC089187 TaxID=3154970 RepID=UPI00341B6079
MNPDDPAWEPLPASGPAPRARLEVGHTYSTAEGALAVTGVVVYSEWDADDRQHYYWEEWRLSGGPDHDMWLQFDHYSRRATLFRPVNTGGTPSPGSVGSYSAVIDGTRRRFELRERGRGTVVRSVGDVGEVIAVGMTLDYADLVDQDDRRAVLSIESFQSGDVDTYLGEELTGARQRALFGRRVTPVGLSAQQRRWVPITLIGVVLLGVVVSCSRATETYCTPRSAITTTNTTTDEVVSSDANQICYRRPLYGGGGGGLGK